MALLAKINAVVFLMMIASVFGVSMAAVYNVGDSAGWTSAGAVDYHKWADHKDFHVGDTLVFKYNNQFHNVKQVSQKDFLSCDATSPINTYGTGSDSVTLKSASHYHFLCGFPGHCQAGQKVEILVTPASLRPTPSPVLSPPSHCTDQTSTTPTTSTSTDKNAANSLYSSNFVAFTMLAFCLAVTGFAF
ncbi:hypothetical protein Dsin_000283 [Dipteronia sinensis]|uniref:Phytocyanin domain-containing protein n=1 Tax=Dipteronia sinensis TaxID=43782 RepID=A0AAE0B2Y3_9ROSI|nr:hypothetical protein Dsin_000283 [Dipteronia sinensis]